MLEAQRKGLPVESTEHRRVKVASSAVIEYATFLCIRRIVRTLRRSQRGSQRNSRRGRGFQTELHAQDAPSRHEAKAVLPAVLEGGEEAVQRVREQRVLKDSWKPVRA